MYIAIFLAGYLAIGYLLHLVVFPEDKPPVTGYFKPGDVFYSRSEKFRQTVTSHENGVVNGYCEIEPFAPGPPKHFHGNFDEVFEIENGELSIWVNGEVKKLKPGEKLVIPRGTPHQPFNETGDTIRTRGSFLFPEKFAYNLNQMYGCVDKNPSLFTSPKAIFQLSLFQQAGFDSYLVEGPPVFVQKLTVFLVTPLARLMGYKSYYKEFEINKN